MWQIAQVTYKKEVNVYGMWCITKLHDKLAD